MTAWMSEGRTAVITGGASGIGLASAEQFLSAGMNVVIADRDEAALAKAAAKLGEAERVLAAACDVTDEAAMAKLREAAAARFGNIHCLMNNAGVGVMGKAPWEDVAAMKSLIETNLWGVIHGSAAFIPGMLAHGEPGAVINTGSKQGITRPPGNIAYNISKAGVLAYTESIAHAFRGIENCQLSAHLLVPGFVYTGMISRFIPQKPPFAATSEETVAFMVEALKKDSFYIICPDNETTREMDEKRIQWTAEDMIKDRPALSRWHPDFEGAFKGFMGDG